MLKGNISNIPAPSIIIDSSALFEKKILRYLIKKKYLDKIIQCSKEINIVMFIEKGKIPKKVLDNSPYPFIEIIEKSVGGMVWYLRRNKKFIFTDEKRAGLFAGRAYLLDGTIRNIIGEAK